MDQLRIFLLGSFQVTLGSDLPLTFKSNKDRALLAYLAVEAGRPHGRDTLAALLWPDMPDRDARSNLRYTLSSLRRSIGDGAGATRFLVVTRDTVQFNRAAPAWVDVGALRTGLPATALFDAATAENALHLYRGPFLEGFVLPGCIDFEAWMLHQRERLAWLVMEAYGRVAEYHEHRHEYTRALSFARPCVDLEPWNEIAQRRLLRLLARDGRRSAALAHGESVRAALQAELGVEPEPATLELIQQIRAGALAMEPLPVSDQVLRGYELHNFIGAGHTGVVYRAYQPVVDRDVAIKIIRPEYADRPAFIRRFEAEARLVARLEHPHIVPLYDFWREPGAAFLVMRWLRGGSLADAMAGGSWSLDAAVLLMNQIAAALHAAHRQSIVHCDVKPSNVLLDEAHNGYLSDFGIATAADLQPSWSAADPDRAASRDTGSSSYASPELQAGASPTPLADIYSLGVVLFELLTGRVAVCTRPDAELPLLSSICSDLPPALDKILERATAADPAARFPDALAFAHALQQAARPGSAVTAAVLRDDLVLTNPYKGLQAFEEADAAVFFGRTQQVQRVIDRLAKPGPLQRFLAIVGPSGCGKSSLAHAGLVPRLRSGALMGSADWYIVAMTPGPEPFARLAESVLRVAACKQPDLAAHLRKAPDSLLRTAVDLLPTNGELLLLVDQFEELYSPEVDAAERDAFLHCLATAVTGDSSRVRVLVCLRADFYDRPLLHPMFARLMQERTEVVVPLVVEELTAAIEEPARRAGVALEDALTAALIADLIAQPGALPLLQFALTELFAYREGRVLTHAAYTAVGGVAGSLAQRAEAVFLSLSAGNQATARQTFLRLVTLQEGAEDTRRRVLLTELNEIADAASITAVLEHFGVHRLLTFDRDPATRQPTVEVAHEALLRAWVRLRGWLDESRADLRLQRLLAAGAQEWQVSGWDAGLLLHGSRLAQLEEWSQRTDLRLTEAEQAFLHASLAERDRLRIVEAERAAYQARLERRSRNRLRMVASVFAVAAVVVLMMSLVALCQRREALEAYSLSLTANARTALREGDTATALALALALAATDLVNPPLMAQQTLLDAAYAPGARARYDVATLFAGAAEPVTALAFSSDAQTLFLGFADGRLLGWDWEAETVTGRFTGHAGAVNAILPLPDGAGLLTAADDGLILRWDGRTGQPVQRLADHSGAVKTLDLSQDGRWLVSGGYRDDAFDAPGELFVWDLASGEVVSRLEGHKNGVIVVRFVLDDTAVLAASGDLELLTDVGSEQVDGSLSDCILWDLTAGVPLSTMETLGHDASSIAVLPDDTAVLIGSYYENVTTLFDLVTREPDVRFEGHDDAVSATAVSSDGRRALTGSLDGTLRLWDLDSGESLFLLRGHSDGVRALAMTPHAERAFSATRDGELMRWDLRDAMEAQRFVGHGDMVYDVAVSPDGRKLYSVSGAASPSAGTRDTSLRLWDVASGEQLAVRMFPDPVLWQVDISPSGDMVLADGILCDAESLAEVGRLVGYPDGVWVPAVALGPDGQTAVTGTTDGTVTWWGLARGQPIHRFKTSGLTGLWSITFGPDGRSAFIDSADSVVALWDLATGEPLRDYLPAGATPGMGATGAVLHPDGESVLVAAEGGSIYRFDIASGALLATFGPHQDIRTRVQVTPDGKLMLSSGMNGELMLWDLESGNLVRRFGRPGTVIFDITIAPDGRVAYAGLSDATIVAWRLVNPPPAELREWILGNRYVPPLNCAEQVRYGIAASEGVSCTGLGQEG